MKRVILTKSHYSSSMTTVDAYEGEAIETKCARITETGEPISDGAPLVYTEKKDGVQPQYNVRADKWEIAQEAMDKVNRAKIAKGQAMQETPKGEEKKTADGGEGKTLVS